MTTPEPYGQPYTPPPEPHGQPYTQPYTQQQEPYAPSPLPSGHVSPPAHAAPRRLRPVHLAVAAGSLLAGVALTVAVLLLAGWRHVPVNRYEVRVFVDAQASADQVEAVRAALGDSPAGRDVRVRTPQESYADLQKLYAASGDTVPSSVTPESLPRMVVGETTGRDFDCGPYTAVKGLTGVTSVRVGEYDDGVPVAATEC